jgi:uncharacterized protein (DUF488 family)
MNLYTIGFTKKSAERFFDLVSSSGASRLIDVRLNNVSQLAGFAKRTDLEYFLRTICNVDYQHIPLLAPTQEMLDAYKKSGGSWASYEQKFNDLIEQRNIETKIPRELLENAILLCSEDGPHHCHRRLVAEYLQERWGSVAVTHLT